ncbi:MAG: hypothetical protein WD575_02415, partial [Nitriliruptoraceae bacterium]
MSDGAVRDVVERLTRGSALWGIELDPRYRVLGATIQPSAVGWSALEAAVGAQADTDDRVQVLVFPVSVILGSLREDDGGALRIRTFEAEQLVDVSARLGGAAVAAPVLGRPEPQPGEWAPQWSLEGRSNAPDGRRRTITWSVQEGPLALDVFARFDDLEVRDSA